MIALLLSPVFIVLFLAMLSVIITAALRRGDRYPEGRVLGILDSCEDYMIGDCYSVVYGPRGVLWVENLMKKVAEISELDFDRTFLGVGNIGNDTAVNDYIAQNQNIPITAFQFSGDMNNTVDVPDELDYTVFYNSTAPNTVTYGPDATLVLNKALLALRSGKDPIINVEVKSFPVPPPLIVNLDFVGLTGSTFFFLPAMINFFVVLIDIVGEKEDRIRMGMRMMGLKNSAYWGSWILTTSSISVINTIILIISCFIANFNTFRNTNILAIFIVFISFSLAMIGLAIFLSSIISKTKSAHTVAYAIIVIGFLMQFILSNVGDILNFVMYSDLSVVNTQGQIALVITRIIFTLFPPINLVIPFVQMSRLASTEEGFTWNDLFKSTETISGTFPAPITSVYVLISVSLAYTIIGVYLDMIIPGEHGSPHPFYFFLTKSFWGCAHGTDINGIDITNPEDSDEDVRSEFDTAVDFEQDKVVRIINISKQYNSCCGETVTAVDDLSLTVEEGEIFCLLGHNGAGKTTLINMLTGNFLPTSGYASIYGKDIKIDMDNLRKKLGICPQHDILWDELTPVQHLELFTIIKGTEVDHNEINALLEQVGLYTERNLEVGTFSGGMKRRLSCAIASIGNPEIIILDEPTTGMDPVNKRAVWHLIQELKKHRVIILTTHSMQEADVLGDRIAIMTHGKLRCIGNSSHLKNKFGTGYTINVTVEDEEQSDYLFDEIFSASTIESKQDNIICYKIPYDEVEKIPTMINALESSENIIEWGINHTSLEDVFLDVTKEHNFVYEEVIEMVEEDITLEHHEKGSYTWRALWSKNFSLLKKQTCSNCCQIMVPLIVLLLIFSIKLVVNINDAPIYHVYTSPKSNLLYNQEYPFYDNGNECLTFFLFSDTSSKDKAGNLTEDGLRSGMLSEIDTSTCQLIYPDTHTVTVPHFNEYITEKDIQDSLYEILLEYYSNILNVSSPPLSYKLPDGYVIFHGIDFENYEINMTVSINNSPEPGFHRQNDFTLGGYYLEHARIAFTDAILKAFSTFSLGQHNIFVNSSVSYSQQMPFLGGFNIDKNIELIGATLYPFALNFQLPIYLFIIVLEKELKLREMMKSHGMKIQDYHIVNYLFNFMFYCIVIVLFWLVGFLVGYKIFSQTNPILIFIFFLGWGLSLVSLSFLISSILNKRRTANMLGYIISLIGTGISVVVAFVVYGSVIPGSDTSSAGNFPIFLYIWPQFGLARGIYLLNDRCFTTFCYGWFWEVPISDPIYLCVASLYFTAIFYYLLFLYLDQILPTEYGVPKHPLFCFLECKSDYDDGDEDRLISHDEDEDVLKERSLIKNHEYADSSPLVIRNLRKVFPPKTAVESLNLVVRKGECFGLLGENGAGKTTAISILIGLIRPTSGDALIDGYNILNDIDQIHKEMGFCPQFDTLWDTLTVEEHILFYARLKGISPNLESEHVASLLSQVGLWEFKNRASKALSGGMKRRLSIAISLAGESKIIFLDEPTTGLDPASRRQIWKLIEQIKRSGIAIILTTHSMDEAEFLCTRIGIMVKGSLRCLGTQQRLKNKFCRGFRLLINFEPNSPIEEFMSSMSNVNLVNSFKGTNEYDIDFTNKESEIANFFEIMINQSSEYGIIDWSFSQLGLDDVFQTVVRNSRKGMEFE